MPPVEEKYFMSIFFPPLLTIESGYRMSIWCRLDIKIIYLPGHCHWFQHGNMDTWPTLGKPVFCIFFFNLYISTRKVFYSSAIASLKDHAAFHVSHVRNMPENETNRETQGQEMAKNQRPNNVFFKHLDKIFLNFSVCTFQL